VFVTDLFQRIEASIRDRRLLKPGGKVLVAVSGGVDSVVLLHALEKISKRRKWKIVVAHFNHQLRGRASDLDEKLVRETAAKMKLPVIVEGADVKAFAGQSMLSTEMAARKLRHEFLARAARRLKIKTIALAHHADDQVELFFLRLLRGSGGEGLGGMKWKSPSPADQRLSLIRPLLEMSKAELGELAKGQNIQYREDATNASSDFLRNRIRNQLLPLLRKDYQPALNRVILRVMEIVGAEAEFVGEAARCATIALDKLPLSVQRRVLQTRLLESGIIPDFDLIESLRLSSGRFISIGPGISAARNNAGKIKLREDLQKSFCPDELSIKFTGRAGGINFNGVKFAWRLSPVDGSVKFPRKPGEKSKMEFFDADKIGKEIVLRHWREGDRFQPIGMSTPVKLQDLFVNAKIPRERRHELVLATTRTGEIFWAEGLRIPENFKITPRTRRTLTWKRNGLVK
jgi:tRNA(Ile)-lysidine synthase